MSADKSSVPVSNDGFIQAIQVATPMKTLQYSAGEITPVSTLARIYNPSADSEIIIKQYKNSADPSDIGMPIPAGMIEYINIFPDFKLYTSGTVKITWTY